VWKRDQKKFLKNCAYAWSGAVQRHGVTEKEKMIGKSPHPHTPGRSRTRETFFRERQDRVVRVTENGERSEKSDGKKSAEGRPVLLAQSFQIVYQKQKKAKERESREQTRGKVEETREITWGSGAENHPLTWRPGAIGGGKRLPIRGR